MSASELKVNCPRCRKPLFCPTELSGVETNCPLCGQPIILRETTKETNWARVAVVAVILLLICCFIYSKYTSRDSPDGDSVSVDNSMMSLISGAMFSIVKWVAGIVMGCFALAVLISLMQWILSSEKNEPRPSDLKAGCLFCVVLLLGIVSVSFLKGCLASAGVGP